MLNAASSRPVAPGSPEAVTDRSDRLVALSLQSCTLRAGAFQLCCRPALLQTLSVVKTLWSFWTTSQTSYGFRSTKQGEVTKFPWSNI